MEKSILNLTLAVSALMVGQAWGAAQTSGQNRPPSQVVRPIGVVERIQPGQLILHTDAGPVLTVRLPEGVRVVRVPPNAKDLKSAATISLDEISVGDRVLILGPVSAEGKSVLAQSVIVMTKTALEQAREAERLEWERRGINGVVRSIDPARKEITLAVPNSPPTPANPTHPVTLTPEPNAVLLRYAPDSTKFSDARRALFSEIKVGDQVRALGTKSTGGTHFAVEKLVSGTFRNIGATVISVDVADGTVTVNDLATGKPLRVRTNADSELHRLPPFIAGMIARFNARAENGKGTPGRPQGRAQEAGPWGSRRSGGKRAIWGGAESAPSGPPGNFQQMLARTPLLKLSELKPGEPLIIVSTQGTRPSEVTAIAVLSGVTPILEARPKGSKEVVLGPWNMSVGGGGDEEGP